MLTSIAHYDLHQITHAEAIHAPSVLRHIGLHLSSVHLDPIPERLAVPAFQEDNIILHMGGSLKLAGRIGRRFQEAVQPGTMFLVPRGQPCEWYFETPCTVMNLFPSAELVRQVALDAADRDPAAVEFAPRIARSDLFLAAGGQALLHTLQHRSTNTLLAAETLVYAIIAHLLRHHTARPYVIPAPESRLSKALLGRLLEYIHAHLGEPLTLAELAAIVHLSPYHLARQFRTTVGQTPHQYVLAQRLVAARLLIGERALPLAAIAAQLGFADQSHLNLHFKRRYGITPGELARRHYTSAYVCQGF